MIIKSIREPILEPILHPSPWRLRALSLSTAMGHPLYYLIWTQWLPQPYESLWQRLLMSLLGLGLLVSPAFSASPPGRLATMAMTLVFWITVPVFFTWMYFCNGRNAVWFATMAAMFLIYYHGTDWRIATVGTVSGMLAGWSLYLIFGQPMPPVPLEEAATHVVVLGFSWSMGLMLGLSASNLRREQLKQALGTMGIMAHELRTPLATMALIGDAVRNEANAAAQRYGASLELLAGRLHAIVRNMNRQIDMQITNAQLMNLPATQGHVSAAHLARSAVAAFPYRNARERECVQVQVLHDFELRGSEPLFMQVIDNLLKNALRALASLPEPPYPGDLVIAIDVIGARGRLVVADRGPGISTDMRRRLFQLFSSTHQGTGHGLGLAFCQRVAQQARGTIRVESNPGRGARFIIELPVATRVLPVTAAA